MGTFGQQRKMRSLLLLSCLLAVIAAQMISDTDIQRHLKAGGHNIAVDGAWGKGSHAAFDKWATDNFGSAYLNKRELYKSQGKSRYSIRHDEMFHSFWAEHPLPPHSYSHPQLSRQSDSGLDVEVGKTNRLIREHSGESPVPIRPPYGATNPV